MLEKNSFEDKNELFQKVEINSNNNNDNSINSFLCLETILQKEFQSTE
jgi:hypothetical protein